ncbi:probable multidrug resistance-associated protein lethal(2)03659 isoform X2 [Photinus pyralis]|uniref:probable multidrug resistance-associated protein lethal(2)03659 isoform X2 n=1 Tax=Photinus pyralis TaxID=7054 RepID=UPI0012670EF4|nr:probable multidrug resistance-associated protein lethal(2)03659 isoform X2 [Photinus pyralis]
MNRAGNVKRKSNPRQNASALSAATFFYTLPTFTNKKNGKLQFDEEDLYETLSEYQSEVLANKIETLWKEEYKKRKGKASLTRVIISAFGFEYFVLTVILGISALVLKPAQAVFLGRLLLYYMPAAEGEPHVTQLEARLYAAGIALMAFLYILSFHPLLVQLYLVGLKVKIACSSLIYRKALKLSDGAFNSTNVGQIVNLIASDAPMFINCSFLLNYLWIGPLQCIIVTYLMYQEVGFSSICGIAVLFLLIPIHHFLGKAASTYRWKAASRTDGRVCYMDEIISGIKVIKMNGWERLIKPILLSLRNLEIKYIRLSMYLKAANVSFDILTIPIVIYVSTVVYVLHNHIRADKVFTMMIFYNSLRATMASTFPHSVSVRALTMVAIKRIEKFLFNPEINMESIEDTTDPIAIRIIDGHAKWGESPTLEGVNLAVKPASLVIVTGPVGCGKSSLLSVMLKELRLGSGRIHISGQISYSSQDAWLFSSSIRNNILFGEQMDTKRYNEVVRVCALEDDFASLPFADQTIVGGRGSSLSGGQKARINLARAVYRDADIYLLDEPFAAVDARVGKQIFQDCIKGFLKGKTVVLVTHQLQYLKYADEIAAMENGTITSQGQLVSSNQEGIDAEMKELNCQELVNHHAQDIVKEHTSVGSVSSIVYRKYVTANGFGNFVVVVVLFLVMQAVISSGPYFLTHWVNTVQVVEQYTNASNYSSHALVDNSQTMYIYVYSAITIASIVIVALRSYLYFNLALKSSQRLHNNMFNKVTGATMHFFNTNSQGRIINRFSQDVSAVDTLLPNVLIETVQLLLASFAAVLLISLVNYWLIIPTLAIGFISYCLKKFCLLTTRNIKRLEGVTRSPVFEHLSSSLQGLGTIRALQAETILREEFDSHQDLHSCCYHLFLCTSHGFGYFLDCLCAIYIAIVTFSFVISDNDALSGDVGLAITQSITLMGYLQLAVLQTAELENNMTSVERILEYDDIEQEDNVGTEPPKTWPGAGRILFCDVSLQYSTSGAPVLKNLNFEIFPREKVGIIGRTGAGTLRQNLDPFEEYEDTALWKALDEVELKQFVASQPQGLCHAISQGGANVSVGQRQLICLTRAILRKNSILIMDEATANVDFETDNLIQSTIRKKFQNCTVLTIAHRLQTVMDSDRILVMNAGELVEFDKPSVLLNNTNGYFYKIVQQLRKNDSTTFQMLQ